MTDQPDDAMEEEFWSTPPPPPDDGEVHDINGFTEISHVEDGERIREIVNGVRTHRPKGNDDE
jgi:hypothetical protein